MTIPMKSLAATAILLATVAFAQEEKRIPWSDLPPGVQHTVSAEKKGYSIQGFEQEMEKGQTVYEAKFKVPGGFNKTDKSITMDANGSVIEVGEWISKYALSEAVLKSLKAQAGEGKIVKCKTITKNGQLVAYQAKVMTNGKKSKVQASPDGTALDRVE